MIKIPHIDVDWGYGKPHKNWCQFIMWEMNGETQKIYIDKIDSTTRPFKLFSCALRFLDALKQLEKGNRFEKCLIYENKYQEGKTVNCLEINTEVLLSIYDKKIIVEYGNVNLELGDYLFYMNVEENAFSISAYSTKDQYHYKAGEAISIILLNQICLEFEKM